MNGEGALEASPAADQSTIRRNPPLRDTAWSRSSAEGWWAESDRAKETKSQIGTKAIDQALNLAKVTVTCGISSGDSDANFVSLRDSQTVFQERGFDVTGLFIKICGQSGARSFSLDTLSPDGLDPLHLWVDSVPNGAVILMAIVGIDSDIQPVLQALSRRGVPQEAPPPEMQVLACISTAGAEPTSEAPCANHASPDVAYASLLFGAD